MLPHFICGHGACGSMHTKRHTRMYYTFLGEGGNQARKFALFEHLHQHGAYLSFRTGSMTEMGPSPLHYPMPVVISGAKEGRDPLPTSPKEKSHKYTPSPPLLSPSLLLLLSPHHVINFGCKEYAFLPAKFCHRRRSSTNWKLVAERTGASTFFKKKCWKVLTISSSFGRTITLTTNYICALFFRISFFPVFSLGIVKETGGKVARTFSFSS